MTRTIGVTAVIPIHPYPRYKEITTVIAAGRATDSATKGNWFAPLWIRSHPQPRSDEHAPDINAQFTWAPKDFPLAPGESHSSTATYSEPCLVVTRALAFVGSESATLLITKNGAVLGAGSPLRLPVNRVGSTAFALLTFA